MSISLFLDNFNSKHTKRAYKRDIADFIKFVGFDDFTKIEVDHLVAYKNSIAHLAPKTINRKFTALRSLFEFLKSRGQLKDNPVTTIKLPKASVKKATQAFTDAEAKAVIEAATDPKHKLILIMLFNTAIRRSELANLKVKDIIIMGDVTIALIAGKGGKYREVPLNNRVVTALGDLSERNPEDSIIGVDGNTIYTCVKTYVAKAGITKNLSPHSCRATAITKAIEIGAPITEVADMAGHSNISTTQIYWKRRRGHKHSPVHKLEF